MLTTRATLFMGIAAVAFARFVCASWQTAPRSTRETTFALLNPSAKEEPLARIAAPPFDFAETSDRLVKLPASERLAAVTSTLFSLGDTPALATDLTRRLCATDPNFVREYGAVLIATLVEFGHGPEAVEFAATGGPESAVWLDAAFSFWATHSPEAATRAALERPNGDGLSAASNEWAQQNPAALAEFALRKTSGPRQTLALEQALTRWLDRDPRSATAWLAQFEPSRATP